MSLSNITKAELFNRIRDLEMKVKSLENENYSNEQFTIKTHIINIGRGIGVSIPSNTGLIIGQEVIIKIIKKNNEKKD